MAIGADKTGTVLVTAVTTAAKPGRPKGAVTNAGWNAFGTACSIVISFVSAPVLIHTLGTSQYGILLLIGSVTGILGVMSFGLGEATLRYVAHYHGRDDLSGVSRVFRSTLSFYFCVSLGVIALMFAGAPIVASWFARTEAGLVALLFRLSAISFSLGLITSAFAVIPSALQRFDITNKIAIVANLLRTGGYLALALSGFKLLHLILWDLLLGLTLLAVYVILMRKLLPSVSSLPSFSFSGLKEIFGYSVFTFLTYGFLMMYRESGKLIVGSRVGPSGIAYLGTPDNVAFRIYMVVISGIETLVPRFSAAADAVASKKLLVSATWSCLAICVATLVPLAVLMPQLLTVWINPEFSKEGSLVGQCLALSFIANASFAPIATYFRGRGRPAIVTGVLAAAGITVLGFSVLLVPIYGVVGVGMAYLLCGIVWLIAIVVSWIQVFGKRLGRDFVRSVAVPLAVATGAYFVQAWLRDLWVAPSWLHLICFGSLFAGMIALVLASVDLAFGGDSPAKQMLARISGSRKVNTVMRHLLPKYSR